MKTVAIGVVSVLFSILANVAMAQSIPERECKPAVLGNGKSFIQHVAKRDTVLDWKAKVRDLYGPEWANYGTAKVKRFPCSTGGWFKQNCVVRAQPCLEVEGS
ncbi:MAG: hypothetical protein ACRBBN_13425 [Methyloligellaceae bacterium]